MYNRCEKINCDAGRTLTFPTAGQFEPEDRELVQIYLDKYGPRSCEYSFANLFCWQTIYHYSWRLYKGRLLMYDGENQCAFMPLGKAMDLEELLDVSRFLIQNGLEPNFGVVPEHFIAAHPDLDRYYTIDSHRDYAEYIYEVERLYDLTGTKLHKKRNLISQFKRRYPDYDIRPMAADGLKPARALAAELLARRNPVTKDLLDESVALEKALDFFGELGLEGVELWVGEALVAFAVFSPLGRDTYDVHFEKIDIQYKGAGQMINWAAASYLRGKCSYVNREQDLGIPGLRKAKLSYEPFEIMEPYFLTLKERL